MNNHKSVPMYGVYRRLQNGALIYVSRSATTDLKLAQEIAADFSAGKIVRPDGSTMKCPAHPHVVKEIEAAQRGEV